jgi:hypothetical protein
MQYEKQRRFGPMGNMRTLLTSCRKCGAAPQEYCKHCSSNKPDAENQQSNAQLALIRQKRLLEIMKKDSQRMNRLNLIQKLEEIISLNQMAIKNMGTKND